MDFVQLALQLQAEIDGVVHHSLNWDRSYGGRTRCGIEFSWVGGKHPAAGDPDYERFKAAFLDGKRPKRVPAQRLRGDATCVVCLAVENHIEFDEVRP